MARKRRQKSFGWQAQMLLITLILMGVMFSAETVILAIGMVPTIVAAIVDRSENRVKAITVGAMNFAGCLPFMIDVFKKGNGIGDAIGFILQPKTIVIMYFAAGMGYLIDWALTGIVSSIMVQRAKARLKDIEKTQKSLVERWGAEVTGTIPIDEFGFPRDLDAAKVEEE